MKNRLLLLSLSYQPEQPMLAETTTLPKNQKESPAIDTLGIKRAAALVRAVNNPVRQKILKFISSEEPVAVNTLYRKLYLRQAATSQQLALLRRAGLVTGRREGKQILYSVHTERLHKLAQAVALFVGNEK